MFSPLGTRSSIFLLKEQVLPNGLERPRSERHATNRAVGETDARTATHVMREYDTSYDP